MSKDNGGAAFPNITPDMPVESGPGMSLRDYFAANAMQGLVAGSGNYVGIVEYTERDVAKNAYVMADSMLEARK